MPLEYGESGLYQKCTTRLTQHISDINDNGTGLRRNRVKCVAASSVIVALTTRADLQPVLAIALEQQSEASDVSVSTGSPSSGCILGCHVVNHTHLGQVVFGIDVHRFAQMVLGKAQSDRETGH